VAPSTKYRVLTKYYEFLKSLEFKKIFYEFQNRNSPGDLERRGCCVPIPLRWRADERPAHICSRCPWCCWVPAGEAACTGPGRPPQRPRSVRSSTAQLEAASRWSCWGNCGRRMGRRSPASVVRGSRDAARMAHDHAERLFHITDYIGYLYDLCVLLGVAVKHISVILLVRLFQALPNQGNSRKWEFYRSGGN